MIEITRELAVSLAAEAVKERGWGYVNPSYYFENRIPTDNIVPDGTPRYEGMCRYVSPEGAVGCIVGVILNKAGVDLETLQKHEGDGVWSVLNSLRSEDIFGVDHDTCMFLGDLQSAQDAGRTWGQALDYATN